MALGSLKAPFSHPDWLFELKYDGFRALAHIDGMRTQLVSRNGHPFASFSDLGNAIATAMPHTERAVLDGEIVCLDRKGRPQFERLLFHRGVPCFFAFDLLYDGKDRRRRTRGSQTRTEANDWTILTYFALAVRGSRRRGGFGSIPTRP